MRRIALGLEMSDSFDYGVMRGVIQYAKVHRSWRLYGYGWMFLPLGSLEQWSGDGVIVRLQYREDLSFLKELKCPVIDLAEAFPQPEISSARNNDLETGRIAAVHFRERGFSSFAYCGISGVQWAQLRLEGFLRGNELARVSSFERPLRWWLMNSYSQELAAFLKKLPMPSALFCCNDKVGLRISGLCETIGIRIPHDLAVLGVDNDEIVCELANPSLSSVELASEQIGWEAARLLDEKMNRIARHEATVRTIAPVGIRQRGSTETHATHDPLVQGVLRCVTGKEGYRKSVQDVVNELAVSRRVLEKRFKLVTNSTIHERIVLQRIQHARDLLETSNEKVDSIARACGFGSSQRFFVQFRRYTGMTTNEYRLRRRRTHGSPGI